MNMEQRRAMQAQKHKAKRSIKVPKVLENNTNIPWMSMHKHEFVIGIGVAVLILIVSLIGGN